MKRIDRKASASRWSRIRAVAAALRHSIQAWQGFIHLAWLAAAVLLSSPALAEGQELGLEQALSRALAQNKELAAFEYRLAEEEGRLVQSGLLPNPELAVEVEDFAGSGRFDGFDSAQTTLSLGWVLERNIRRRRVGVGQARSEMAVLDARLLQLDVGAETAQRFLACLASQARVGAADEAVSLAEDMVAVVGRRVRAGKASKVERTRAEAKLAVVRLLRDDVEHELAMAYHRLAAQWGELEPQFSHVEGELLRLPAVQPFASLMAGLERNPQLLRLSSEERLADAKLALEAARRWPTLRPSLGVRRYEATNDIGVVAELKIGLPVFDRNQGKVMESRAALRRTRADSEAVRVRVRTALFEMYEELQHFFHRADTLRDEVLPRLANAMQQMRRGYERGRYGYFELHQLQAELLEARSELIESSAGAHRLVIALERLTGERVVRP